MQSDKEDPGIKKILEEMIKPAEKITEIQTPCKADGVSAYPFNNLPKAVERVSTAWTVSAACSTVSGSCLLFQL